jgi:hypothetical protein
MMALTAPFSKYKRNSFLIWMAAILAFTAYCVYDGYYHQEFIKRHSPAGKADSVLVFNQKAPPYLVGIVVFLGVYLFVISKRKVVAEDNTLVINCKTSVAYDSIESIDKTDFDSKGRFTITYKGPDGKVQDCIISDKNYDNLKPLLDFLVTKIS